MICLQVDELACDDKKIVRLAGALAPPQGEVRGSSPVHNWLEASGQRLFRGEEGGPLANNTLNRSYLRFADEDRCASDIISRVHAYGWGCARDDGCRVEDDRGDPGTLALCLDRTL